MSEVSGEKIIQFDILWLILIILIAFFLSSNIQQVKGDWSWDGTIYIKNNGLVEPSDAPISTVDESNYELNDDIVGNSLVGIKTVIVIEKSDITIDGNGHSIKFTSQWSEGYPIGISIAGEGTNVTIRNFEIRGFMFGIKSDTNEFQIVDCKITDNIFADNNYGIFLGNSGHDNKIMWNQISNNLAGINIQWSWHNHVCNNTIMNNANGIELGTNSSYNEIIDNRIENNGWIFDNGCGVELSGQPWARNNIFYHNDFINNHQQISLYSSNINYWDNGLNSAGNYWSDYTGSDLKSGFYQNETCKDGIGDTPYIIDENNKDSYPLLKPWKEHLNPPVARFF